MTNWKEIIHRLALVCIFFTVGISIGETHRGKGNFFVSWYGNDLYYGESVRVKDSDEGAHFYNDNCKKLTIVGLYTEKANKEAWVKLEGCSGPLESEGLESFDQSSLEERR